MIQSVENEQDFDFLAGMLLLQRVNGIVVFTKVHGLAKSESPRTLRVLGLSNFTCPWTFAKTNTPIRINVPLLPSSIF